VKNEDLTLVLSCFQDNHQRVTIVFQKKWYSFKPISYVGLVLVILGIIGQRLFYANIALIKVGWVVIIIIGIYLITRGRKEHGI